MTAAQAIVNWSARRLHLLYRSSVSPRRDSGPRTVGAAEERRGIDLVAVRVITGQFSAAAVSLVGQTEKLFLDGPLGSTQTFFF